MTNRFHICNYTGQGALTRGQGILRQINIKIHLAKIQYRYARAALLELRGHGPWEDRLAVLTDEDVCVLNERALAEEEEVQADQLDELSRVITGPAQELLSRRGWQQGRDPIPCHGYGIALWTAAWTRTIQSCTKVCAP
jgi:hypothetical protein